MKRVSGSEALVLATLKSEIDSLVAEVTLLRYLETSSIFVKTANELPETIDQRLRPSVFLPSPAHLHDDGLLLSHG